MLAWCCIQPVMLTAVWRLSLGCSMAVDVWEFVPLPLLMGLCHMLSEILAAAAVLMQEKLRPIDKKLAYQMEKLLAAAQQNAVSQREAGTTGAAGVDSSPLCLLGLIVAVSVIRRFACGGFA